MQQKTKRRIIIAVIILLIVCLIACLTLCDRDDKPEHKRAPSNTIVEVDGGEAEQTDPAPEEDAKSDEEQPAKETAAQSQSDKKPAASSGGSSSSASSGSGSTVKKPNSGSSGSSGDSTTTDKSKEKVWVVDKAAWTEQQPIWAPTWWVEYQDGYVYTTFSEAEAFNLYGTKDPTHGIAHSWGTGEDQIKGYKTINHPEEGHWEYR